ncbi:MAG TPA: hypothetical protein VMT16_08520 [Thermoanaerobaculia bacterium]|nr:hypothetical protein [Thermoanaerobaculia bacterium]
MKLAAAQELARQGRLYPAVILHGGLGEQRLAAAEGLTRILLCAAEPAARPCGACRHCRRITLAADDAFHPDLAVVRRDLKASTSVEAARAALRLTQQSPFEARGQVVVVAEAGSLTGEAANALLKVLEEPPVRAPRNFLLLAPSLDELLPTLRSRSWALYLGGPEALPPERVAEVADELRRATESWQATGSPAYLLVAAAALGAVGGWEDLRAERPWAFAAAAAKQAALALPPGTGGRRALLALAAELLEAPRLRLRAIPASRILEGLVARRFVESGAKV